MRIGVWGWIDIVKGFISVLVFFSNVLLLRFETCWDVVCDDLFYLSNPMCPSQVQPLCGQGWRVPWTLVPYIPRVLPLDAEKFPFLWIRVAPWARPNVPIPESNKYVILIHSMIFWQFSLRIKKVCQKSSEHDWEVVSGWGVIWQTGSWRIPRFCSVVESHFVFSRKGFLKTSACKIGSNQSPSGNCPKMTMESIRALAQTTIVCSCLLVEPQCFSESFTICRSKTNKFLLWSKTRFSNTRWDIM